MLNTSISLAAELSLLKKELLQNSYNCTENCSQCITVAVTLNLNTSNSSNMKFGLKLMPYHWNFPSQLEFIVSVASCAITRASYGRDRQFAFKTPTIFCLPLSLVLSKALRLPRPEYGSPGNNLTTIFILFSVGFYILFWHLEVGYCCSSFTAVLLRETLCA